MDHQTPSKHTPNQRIAMVGMRMLPALLVLVLCARVAQTQTSAEAGGNTDGNADSSSRTGDGDLAFPQHMLWPWPASLQQPPGTYIVTGSIVAHFSCWYASLPAQRCVRTS